ncbi:MAG: molybdenum cofactor biosynthesis protein MoaE [Candidatus Saliniplasma sp.]
MNDKIVVTEDDFNIDELKDKILDDSSGAVVVFNGVVRDHNQGKKVKNLEIQRYPEMTEEELKKVRDEAINNFKIDEILIVHRYGLLEVGDNIVGIIVTASHREAAFTACKYCIDRLKEIVPLWKKETTLEGETEWVGDQE